MQTIFFQKTSELRRNKDELERKLNIKINIKGKKVTIKGSPIDEYEASLVLDAINLGFSARNALTLKDESKIFRILNIKDITRKKNLENVRARIIGREGKTKRTIENITGCDIIIKDNEIGIIGDAESIENVITGISNLVRGTKQSNTYRYLEKMNKRKRESL